MPSRRTVLAAGGALLTAGCLQSGTGSTGTDPDDETATDDPTTDGTETDDPTTDGTGTDDPDGTGEPSPDGCRAGFYVSADAFDPAVDLPVHLGDAQRSLVDRAAADGPVTVETYAHSAPVDDGVVVERDGTFYETTVERTGTTEVPARLVDVEWEKGQTAPDDASSVAFEDLPAVDRFALRMAVYGPAYRREGSHPTQGLSVTDYPAPYPDGTDDSRLVGAGETWVRWNDRTYRVVVGGEATNTRHGFRVDLAAVAGNRAAFRDWVAREYLLDLSDVPDDERAILRAAAEHTYEECEPASEALQRLRDRLDGHPTLPGERTWYVAFDGARYELGVTNWVA